ncbi:DUF3093 domain-containing protein [Homoserinimonas hongtaonis]|uniref:DUF3093 domain-containing protein n=1 Tax=Homoserinimonas hongtaonis TaxID=2079791 RepID=UPI000D332B64|nr:DUF3093 domain-containing protein [Salinibacterium hongtaonis]AWB89324.1 DUF3093 domain-containing protein [Salinibacterium hongtaonis]
MILFRERLLPSRGLLVALLLLIPATLLVFLPINQTVGVVAAIALYLASCGTLIAISPVVEVTPERITVGRASLPIEFAGAPEAYSGGEATAERGVRLDARAWIVFRGGIASVVKIPVVDEKDPAPYWLISSRRPDQFVSAVSEAKRHTPSK